MQNFSNFPKFAKKIHIIPKTLSFLLFVKSKKMKIDDNYVIHLLLRNHLENEACFLLSSGY